MLDYKCFTPPQEKRESIAGEGQAAQQQIYVDFRGMKEREVPVSSIESQVKAKLMEGSQPDQRNGRNLSVGQKYMCYVKTGEEIIVKEKLKAEPIQSIKLKRLILDIELCVTEENHTFILALSQAPSKDGLIMEMHRIISDEEQKQNQSLVLQVPIVSQPGETYSFSTQTSWRSDLGSKGMIGVVVYSKKSFTYFKISDLSVNAWDYHTMKEYQAKDIYKSGLTGQAPDILRVKIAESELLYLLDSTGKITIINKNLDNGDSGIIFIHKKTQETFDFFLMSALKGPFVPDEPQNNISLFKRNNNLEACGFMICLSSNQVKIWNMGNQIRKNEGDCELSCNLILDNTEIINYSFKKDLLLLVHQLQNGNITFSLLQIQPNKIDNKASCFISQLNKYSITVPKSVQTSPNHLSFELCLKESHSESNFTKNLEIIILTPQTHEQPSNSSLMMKLLIKHISQGQLYKQMEERKMIQRTQSKAKEQMLSDPKLQDSIKNLKKLGRNLSLIIKNFGLQLSHMAKSFNRTAQEIQIRKAKERILIQLRENIIQQNSNNNFFGLQEEQDEQEKLPANENQKRQMSVFEKNMQILLGSQNVQNEPEEPQIKQSQPLSKQTLTKIQNYFSNAHGITRKYAEQLQTCSNSLKKKNQQIALIQGTIKDKLNLHFNNQLPKIIDERTKNVTHHTISKSSVYIQNSQQIAVKQMCQRVFAKALNEEIREEKELRAKEEEELKSSIGQNQRKELSEVLSETFKDIFGKQLSSVLLQTVSQVNQEFIVKPYSSFRQSLQLENIVQEQ